MTGFRWRALLAATCTLAGSAAGVEGADPPIRFVEHVVVEGDTVFLIATHYGSTVDLVVAENRIEDVRRLFVGKRLRVPVVSDPDPMRAEAMRRGVEAPDPGPAGIARLARLVARAEAELADARFEAAMETASGVSGQLAAYPRRDVAALLSRIEMVGAVVQVAMGDSDRALASMQRALQADPQMDLDPVETPPKVLSLFRSAQAARGR